MDRAAPKRDEPWIFILATPIMPGVLQMMSALEAGGSVTLATHKMRRSITRFVPRQGGHSF